MSLAKLLEFVQLGRYENVKSLIKSDLTLVDEKTELGITALHRSSCLGNASITELLLEHNAQLENKDESGWTALHWASAYGRKDVVSILINKGASLTAKTNSGWTALHWASAYGCIDVAAMLILQGANPDVKAHDGRSPIDIARGYLKSDMETYLEEYLEVIQLPIHRSIWERATSELVVARLEATTDGVKQKDRNGKLPIHYAIEMKAPVEVVEALLNAYPDSAKELDRYNYLPIHRAIELSSPSRIIILLLNAYRDAAKMKHHDHTSPILKALEMQLPVEVIEALAIAHPEGTMERDANSRLPIHITLQNLESSKVTGVILAAKPSMAEVRDFNGQLPLIRALEIRASGNLVMSLLKAYPNAAAERGKDGNLLPLHRAIDLEYAEEVVLLLLSIRPNAAREKARDGMLALHRAIDKQASEGVIKELIRVYPDALNQRTKDLNYPIHLALEKSNPLPIVSILLAANPNIAKERDKGGILPLSRVLERDCKPELVKLILLAYPAAAKETGRDRNLPLHRAIDLQMPVDITLEILNAYPEGASRLDKGSILPIHRCIEKLTDVNITAQILHSYPESAWIRDKAGLLPIKKAMDSSKTDAYVSVLLPYTLPFNKLTGEPVSDQEYIWTTMLQLVPEERFISAIESTLKECSELVENLANATDKHGRKAIDIATPLCKQAIQSQLHFFGRYELKPGAPEHQSKTCIVRLAVDYKEDRRPVALKFMQNLDQFKRELSIRQKGDLSEEFVVNIIRDHNSDEDPAFRAETQRKKGYEGYPYCLVMPAADRNLAAVLAHEHIAGKDWDQIKVVCRQVAHALGYMHSKELIHGDIKPLNIMRQGAHIKLIDLDASASFARDSPQYSGAKFSSAYIPPELVYLPPDVTGGTGSVPVVKEALFDEAGALRSTLPYDAVLAAPTHDMWAFGIVMFQICSGETLFHANDEDNIDEESLRLLYDWKEDFKTKKLAKIVNPDARNLVAQLLSKEPKRRPLTERVLAHPFLSGKKASRMVGESAEYDVFLSYRVSVDGALTEMMYNMLTALGIKVWWDRMCLQPGEDWEEGFCDGLVKSRTFVCLLSRHAIENYAYLEPDSRIDNVLLEQTLALELEKMGLIEKFFPVLIGDLLPDGSYSSYFRTQCHPVPVKTVVNSVLDKLREHLERQGLGTPLNESPTVEYVLSEVTTHQAGFLQGDGQMALENVVKTIFGMVSKLRQDDREKVRPTTAMSFLPIHGDTGRSFNEAGGSGLRGALAALQAQVNSRNEEILRLEEDIAKRDLELGQCQEEINQLKERISAQVQQPQPQPPAQASNVQRKRSTGGGLFGRKK